MRSTGTRSVRNSVLRGRIGGLLAVGVLACAGAAMAREPAPGVNVLSVDAADRAEITALLDPALAEARAPEQAAALERIAGAPFAPAWLAAPLGKLLDSGPAAVRPLAARALSSVRTRESFRLLLQAAGRADQPRVRAAAIDAMGRLTGRRDLGSDVGAWERLLGQVSWVPEAEWRQSLGEWLARGADAATSERDLALARLSTALAERVAGAPDAAARESALRALLKDPYPPVQQLGLTLCLQELANARPLGPAIGADAAALLVHPSVAVRRLAAELLGVLGSPGSGSAVIKALELEADPTVAAELLKAAARSPDPGARVPALRWLHAGEPARPAAMACLLALHEQRLLEDESDRAAALSLLRASRSDDLGVPGVRLLLTLGDASDMERVKGMLVSGTLQQRSAAAEGLGMHAPGLDTLLSAAAADAELRPYAARALQRLRPTAAGFRQMQGLVDATSEAGRQQLLAMGAKLSVADLVAASEGLQDAELRESLLARLTGEPLKPGADAPDDLARGLAALARARLDLRRPGEALKALDALPTARPDAPTLKAVALLCLGRLAQAERSGATPGCYVEGLERSIGQAHAAELVRVMQSLWGPDGSTLPADLRPRFIAARDRAEAFVGPAPDLGRP